MNRKSLFPFLAPFFLNTLPAAEVVMDFDSISVGGGETPVANPWFEDGMKLECLQFNSSAFSDMVIRPSRDTGHISPSAKWNTARLRFTRADSGPFRMKSIQLSPLASGLNSTVLFTGEKVGGGTVTATFNTGGAFVGIVHAFPANFGNLSALTWTVNNNQANFGYHQFDNLTAIVPPVVEVPDPVTLSEGTNNFPLIVRIDEAFPSPTVLNYTLAGNATLGSDYTGLSSSGSVVIPANQQATEINLSILSDADDESPETIEINWSATSTAYFLPKTQTKITIGDMNGSGFPDYVAGHGLLGNDAQAEADPNQDGIDNITAYTFRLNPAGPFSDELRDRLPKFTTRTIGRGSIYPALTWQLPQPWPSDVRFVVEQSTTLNSWEELARRTGYGLRSLWTGPSSSLLSDSGSPTKTVIVPASSKMNDQAQLFLNLKLSYSPPIVISR